MVSMQNRVSCNFLEQRCYCLKYPENRNGHASGNKSVLQPVENIVDRSTPAVKVGWFAQNGSPSGRQTRMNMNRTWMRWTLTAALSLGAGLCGGITAYAD